MALAKLKNDAVCAKYAGELSGAVVLSADTIVVSPKERVPLGKPKDPADAVRMLRLLSGDAHEVITGVMLRRVDTGAVRLFAEVTRVFFRPLGDDEFRAYVASGDPLDKAGAYGIQSGACGFVRRIEGDYCNVVGLPVCKVMEELALL